MQQTEVAIHLALQSELSYGSLEVVRHLGHTHRLVVERAHTTDLLRRRTAMIHIVANSVRATAQCAYHQALGSLGCHDRTGGVNHLDARTHFRTERGIVAGVIARRCIVGLLRQVFEHEKLRRHGYLVPKRIGVGSRHGNSLALNDSGIAPARGSIERHNDTLSLGHALQDTHVLVAHL